MNSPVVITSATSSYFPGLILLAESLAPFNLPLVCVDLGLTGWQPSEAKRCGIRVLPYRYLSLPSNETKQPLAMWLKPDYLIQAAGWVGAQRVLWMDSDTAMLRFPGPLFEGLNRGPVFTIGSATRAEDVANPKALYDLLPAKQSDVILNSGVLALDLERDRKVLKLWQWLARQRANPFIGPKIRLHDQGALAWAVGKLGLKGRVLSDPRLNQNANYCVGSMANRVARGRYPREGMLDSVRSDHPDAMIVHWMRTKWWEL